MDEYASLVVLPSCECKTARKYLNHDQQQRLLQFLMGLNDSYMTLRGQILMMTPLPSAGQAFAILSQEESHRSLISVEPHSVSVFYSTKHKPDMPKKNQLYCEHCHWTDHTKSVCYKLVGYPPGHRLYGQQPSVDYRKNPKRYVMAKKPVAAMNLITDNCSQDSAVNDVSPAPIFTRAQYAEIMKLLGNPGVNNSDQPIANMAGIDHSFALCLVWIIDTGAN